jgi:putative ABC transport system substrate-binding protein
VQLQCRRPDCHPVCFARGAAAEYRAAENGRAHRENDMNKRRKLLVALGAGALAAPLSSLAQPTKVWRVGFLVQATRPDNLDASFFHGFVQGMHELGYVDGKNLEIHWRFAENRVAQLPSLVAELLRLKVDVIVASSSTPTRAAQQATTSIPVVMVSTSDPVGSGFVKSLARPGGNITGLSNLATDVDTKNLEMLIGMVPKLSRVAVMVNPDNITSARQLNRFHAVARKLGVTILPFDARTPQEIEQAFPRMAREKIGGLIVMADSNFHQQVRQIAELAAKYRVPTIAGLREYVEAGGLLSYGANRRDYFRRAATYVDKIFKGIKPADIPVEQPTLFELYINGKTAKALGLKIPQSLLILADKVIE